MRFLYVAVLALLCAGCSGTTQPGSPALPSGLPTPAGLLRQASLAPLVRHLNGAEYELALPSNRVSSAGTALEFSAVEPLSALDAYAYAIYALDLSAYSGVSLLGLDWLGGASAEQVWIGLANWTTDRWDWQAAPAAPETDIGDYSPYVAPGDGRMLIAVLAGTAQTQTLNRVYFGTPGLEPPQNLVATDGDFTDKVALAWEAPLSGPAPESYDVQRADAELGPYSSIGTTASLGYDDMTAVPGTGYWYQVVSTKAGEANSLPGNADSGYCSLPLPGWTITLASTVSPTADPIYISLALVDGFPALVYNRNASNYGVYYVRALDALGSSWGVTQDLQLPSAKEPSLGFFGGLPVIGYTDGFGGTDIFLRTAQNVEGTAWNAPVTVDDLAGAHPLADGDLAAVGGRPAIAFKHSDFESFSGTELCFLRANDDLGNTWPPDRSILDASGAAWNPQLGVLASGLAAIAYGLNDSDFTDPAQVRFVRASDPTGIAWQPPVPIATLSGPDVLAQVQLVLADGNPAVFYYDSGESGGTLYFKRANDALGADWPAEALTLKAGVDFYDAAALVNGHPAVAYVDMGETRLMYREAANDSGSSWQPAEEVETDLRGLGTATLQAYGLPEHPCIAYKAKRIDPDNPGEVRFARRN